MANFVAPKGHRPLSRCLDRCDRVMQDEVGDSIRGQCVKRHNANYVRYALFGGNV